MKLFYLIRRGGGEREKFVKNNNMKPTREESAQRVLSVIKQLDNGQYGFSHEDRSIHVLIDHDRKDYSIYEYSEGYEIGLQLNDDQEHYSCEVNEGRWSVSKWKCIQTTDDLFRHIAMELFRGVDEDTIFEIEYHNPELWRDHYDEILSFHRRYRNQKLQPKPATQPPKEEDLLKSAMYGMSR